MEQEVVLDVKVKNQTLKQQLREAVKEAQNLQERFGATSNEAIQAAKRVANLKEEISDMNQVFKAFNPEEKFNAVIGVASSIAGGFQAVTGAMQLFGAESKDVEKALLKVQAASAFAEGLNNIRGMGDAFSNLKLVIGDGVKSLFTLRGALIATGIGIFTGLVAALVTNWKDLVAWIDKSIPSLGGVVNLFDNIKKVAFGALSSVVEGFKVVGEVIGQVFSGEFSKAVDTAGTFGTRVSQAYTKGYLEEEKTLANERAAKKLEEQIKQHERDLKLIEAQGKDTYALKRKILNEELELLKLQNKKETDEYKNKYNELRALDLAEKKRKDDEELKAFEERKKKNIELSKELNEQAEENKLRTQNYWSDQAKLLQEKTDKEKALRKSNLQEEVDDYIKNLEEQKRLNQLRIDDEERKRLAILGIAQNTLNGLVALAEIGIKNEKKLEQAKKIAALIQIGIDTAIAISGIIKAASQDPKNAMTGGLDIPLKIAAGIATVLANVAKAKQILSSAGSSGAAPSLQSAAPLASTSATTANNGIPMQQGPQQQGQNIANADMINNAFNNPNMVRAVVVETDITDSQRRVRGIEQRATFG